MTIQIRRLQAWRADLPDRVGAAAATLARLAHAGIEPSFLLTRLDPRRPDTTVLYLAPVSGPEQARAAQDVGVAPAPDVALLLVEGPSRPGLAYEIMSRLAVATIPLLSLSISTADGHLTAHLALESHDAAAMAVQVLATLV